MREENIFQDKGSLIHCGSRGFGHQICTDYLRVSENVLGKYGITLPDRELACVPNNSKEGEDYRAAMNCALNFAWTNRQMITHWVRMIFRKVFSLTDQQIENMKLVYDVAHNIAKVERHEIDGEGMRQVVVSYEIDSKLYGKAQEQLFFFLPVQEHRELVNADHFKTKACLCWSGVFPCLTKKHIQGSTGFGIERIFIRNKRGELKSIRKRRELSSALLY